MRHQSHSEEREKQEAGGFILRSLLIGKQSEKDSVVQKKHHATVNNIKMWSRLSVQFLITNIYQQYCRQSSEETNRRSSRVNVGRVDVMIQYIFVSSLTF